MLLGAGVTGAAFGRAIGYLFGALFAFVLIARAVDRRALSLRGNPSGRVRGHRALRGRAAADRRGLRGDHADRHPADRRDPRHDRRRCVPGAREADHLPALPRARAVRGCLTAAVARRRGAERAGVPGGIRYLMILQAALVVPVVVWADPIADVVLGTGFEESADVLRAMAPFIYLFGLAPLVSVGVNYLGEARRRIPVAIAALVVNFVVSIVLLNEIGVVGSAIGADAAYLIYVPAHFWICKQLLGPARAPDRHHVRAHR